MRFVGTISTATPLQPEHIHFQSVGWCSHLWTKTLKFYRCCCCCCNCFHDCDVCFSAQSHDINVKCTSKSAFGYKYFFPFAAVFFFFFFLLFLLQMCFRCTHWPSHFLVTRGEFGWVCCIALALNRVISSTRITNLEWNKIQFKP